MKLTCTLLFALVLCMLGAPHQAHAQATDAREPIIIIVCADGCDPHYPVPDPPYPSCQNSPHGDCTNTRVDIPVFIPPADPVFDGPIMWQDPCNGPVPDTSSRELMFRYQAQCGLVPGFIRQ